TLQPKGILIENAERMLRERLPFNVVCRERLLRGLEIAILRKAIEARGLIETSKRLPHSRRRLGFHERLELLDGFGAESTRRIKERRHELSRAGREAEAANLLRNVPNILGRVRIQEREAQTRLRQLVGTVAACSDAHFVRRSQCESRRIGGV